MVTGQKLASLLERVKNRVEGDLITFGDAEKRATSSRASLHGTLGSFGQSRS